MITTIEDIKNIRHIAENIRSARIEPYISEVELATIMPAIGCGMYEQLDKGELTDEILLNGGYYDLANGTRAFCNGLRPAVAYFAYAKVLLNNQVNVTAFGVTQKSSSFSTPTSDDQISFVVAEARKMGQFFLDSCIAYLHRDEKCGCNADHKSNHRYKMEVIK